MNMKCDFLCLSRGEAEFQVNFAAALCYRAHSSVPFKVQKHQREWRRVFLKALYAADNVLTKRGSRRREFLSFNKSFA
jgi:hypothetical protein